MKRFLCLFILLTMLMGAAIAESDKPTVVCTSFPCFDLARAILGEDGDALKLLIKPGTEVHSYDPSPADIMAIAQADLFIYIGGESDAWVADILDSLGSDAPKSLRLFECVEALEEETVEGMTVTEEEEEETEVEFDEHIWTDPLNAIKMLEMIENALTESDPANASIYAFNADTCTKEIEEIDGTIREILAESDRRELIFADRFPFLYFAREYGLDYYAAFPSCSSESEPSAKTLAFLIDKTLEDAIPVIYTIEMSSGKAAQMIAEETGAEILTFYSVQTISEEDFSAGETYVSLMRKNVEALRKGLN